MDMTTSSSKGWLAVDSVGMVSALGLTAEASCAAIRAGISRFEEIPFHDQQGNPIMGAPAPEAVPDRQGYRRLAPMMAGAIQECMASVDPNRSLRQIPLLIHADTPGRPDYPPDMKDHLRMELQELLPPELSTRIEIFLEGRAGFMRSLLRARALLQRPGISGCILAAADSLLNARALTWLEDEEHLKTEGNSDGIIPGEAAAALWLTRGAPGRQGALLAICGVGLGEEASILEEGAPNLAVGLAHAITSALEDAQMPLEALDFRVGGMTGERLEFMEASTALARVQRVHKDNFDLLVPAEQLGDVGAALPACMIVATALSFVKGYAPGRSALMFMSTASLGRAACVLLNPGE